MDKNQLSKEDYEKIRDFDLYRFFKKIIRYEEKVENIRKQLADRPDFDPLQCYVEIHRPRNKDLCYKHFQIFFDSKGISYLQRDLDYLVYNYSDNNDYKMKEHNFYDIILTHTDFMSAKIVEGRQQKTFSAVEGTMHFKTMETLIKLFTYELEFYHKSEQSKMRMFQKYGFDLFNQYLFKESAMKFDDLLNFMNQMSLVEELEYEQYDDMFMSSKILPSRLTSKASSRVQFEDSSFRDQTQNQKDVILKMTESIWRRMHQNNRRKYNSKQFSRLREYVTPQDYFEHTKVEKQLLEYNEQEFFDTKFQSFLTYTTNQKRSKKKIESYVGDNATNPWRKTEHLPINMKFSSNLYDQKTNQGDSFLKTFEKFHLRQLKQNQFI